MKSELRSGLLLMVSAALGGAVVPACASSQQPAPAAAPAPSAMRPGGQSGSCGAHPGAAPAATPTTPAGQSASCGASGSCGATQPANPNPSGGGGR